MSDERDTIWARVSDGMQVRMAMRPGSVERLPDDGSDTVREEFRPARMSLTYGVGSVPHEYIFLGVAEDPS